MKLTVLFLSTYFLLISLSSTTNLSADKAKQLLQGENLINLNHEQFWVKENLKRVGQIFTTMTITSDQFGILIGNYIVQLLNEEYLYNLNDCMYYAYQIGDLGIKAVTKVTNGFDLWGQFMNIMTILHKEPETVRQYTVVSFASNILFNWADLIDEAYWITVSYLFQDWEYMGKLIAKLTSDLFLKSPIRNSYNYRNSQFLKYRLYRESESTTTVNNANSQNQVLQSQAYQSQENSQGKLYQQLIGEELNQYYQLKLKQASYLAMSREELIDRVNKCVVRHKVNIIYYAYFNLIKICRNQSKQILAFKFANRSERQEFLNIVEQIINEYSELNNSNGNSGEFENLNFDIKLNNTLGRYCQ